MNVPAPFDPVGALEALTEGRVAFVLIGGVAARLHGSPSVTRDLDICYDRTTDNVQRLVDVLRAHGARLRGVDEDLPFLLDAKTLGAGANFTFVTDLGDIDVLASPAGVNGYGELAANADRLDLGSVQILVTSLDDLIRMKRAAGRPKDLRELEILEAVRAEIERDPIERGQR